MNLHDVMGEVAGRLGTIPRLRAYDHPPANVTPPAAIVTFPVEAMTYDLTYGRGSDRFNLPVVVMVGQADAKAAHKALGEYANGSGPRSVKAVLEANLDDYTTFDTLRVTQVEFDIVAMGGVDHLAATFTLDIAGPGG